MTAGARFLRPEPLTRAAFAAFGDVIEAGDAFETINRGTTRQYNKLTEIDVSDDGGRTQISIYRVVPYELPLAIVMLERHPLSSQLFMPLNAVPFLVVVAPPGEHVERASVRAFVTNGAQHNGLAFGQTSLAGLYQWTFTAGTGELNWTLQ